MRGISAVQEKPESDWQALADLQCIDRIEFRNYVCDRK